MLHIFIVSENNAYKQTLMSALKLRFPKAEFSTPDDTKEVLGLKADVATDLVFIDIHRGEGEGIELIRRLRTRFPDTIIVGLADYDWPEYQTAVENAGADHFVPIEKSVRGEVLKLLETRLRDKGFMD